MEGVPTFEQVVRPLSADRSWRRRVRRVVLRDSARRLARGLGAGLSQLGWCHMGLPAAVPPGAVAEPIPAARRP